MEYPRALTFTFCHKDNTEVAVFFSGVVRRLPIEELPPRSGETTPRKVCPALSLPDSLLAEALEVNDRMSASLGSRRSYLHSGDLKETDKARDYFIRRWFDLLALEARHPDPDRRRAAQRLTDGTSKFTRTHRKARNIETNDIEIFLQKVQEPELRNEVELLGLNPMLRELAETNRRFRKLWNDVQEERIARKKKGSGGTIRKEVEKIYDEIVEWADASVRLKPSETANKFILSLNDHIKNTNKDFNVRKGIVAANKAKKQQKEKE